MEPMNGLGVFVVTKDHKVEQERQHIYYDFYLTSAPMFEPSMGYRCIGDKRLPTMPHVGILEALQMENAMKDDFFN